MHSTMTNYNHLCNEQILKIELEFNTYVPVLDPSANFTVICNENSVPIGVNKSPWSIYDYAFDLFVFEKRYNILTFTSSNTLYSFQDNIYYLV